MAYRATTYACVVKLIDYENRKSDVKQRSATMTYKVIAINTHVIGLQTPQEFSDCNAFDRKIFLANP